MKIVISQELQKILGFARDEALRTGCRVIGVDHLMLALLRDKHGISVQALGKCGIDCAEMKSKLDSILFRNEAIPYCELEEIAVSKSAGLTIGLATAEALKCGLCEVEPRHLLLAIAKGESGESSGILAPHADALTEFLDCRKATPVNPAPARFTQIIRINPGNEYPS